VGFASLNPPYLLRATCYSSVSRLQAVACLGGPKTRTLLEATFLAGLRKAGMPEE